MANPKKEGTFKWNTTQTYDNGDVVKWTGKEDSAHPAPTTTVKKGANPNDTHSDSSQGDSIALWIVAIVAIVISLIALFKNLPKFLASVLFYSRDFVTLIKMNMFYNIILRRIFYA